MAGAVAASFVISRSGSKPIMLAIALASVRMPWGQSGEELFAEIFYQKELKWNRFMARCRVVDGAFYDPARRRLTPAPDL